MMIKKLFLGFVIVAGLTWCKASALTLNTLGVMPYDSGYAIPSGYVQMVDNVSSPQYMIFIEATPSNQTLHAYTGLSSYTGNADYDLPSVGLMNLITGRTGGSVWEVLTGGVLTYDGYADWVKSPSSSGTGYSILIVSGNGATGTFYTGIVANQAKFRQVYVGPTRGQCVNYSGASYVGAVVLADDGTAIGCSNVLSGDTDLIPYGGRNAWSSIFLNSFNLIYPRLGRACDDCRQASNANNGNVPIPLGFTINYYGRLYTGVFVNSNGSISFGAGLSAYDQPLEDVLQGKEGICAYCLDLQNNTQITQILNGLTGRTTSGAALRHTDFYYWGRTTFEGRPAFAATWMNMSTFSSNESEGTWNTFQIMLVDTSGANNDVDIIVNYGSIRNQSDQGYCVGTSCNLVAIGLGTSSGGVVSYNSIVDNSGVVLNGKSTQQLRDGGVYALNTLSLNSNIPGRFLFRMENGSLPGTVVDTGPGCMNSGALNYASGASSSNGSCVYNLTGLGATSSILGTIDLTWTPPSTGNFASFVAYSISYSPGNGQLTGSSSVTATGYTLSGLADGTTYTVSVCAVYTGATGCQSISIATPNRQLGGGGGYGTPTSSDELLSTQPPVLPNETSTPLQPIQTDINIFNPSIPDGFCYNRNNNVSILPSQEITVAQEFITALAFLNAYGMTSFSDVDGFSPFTTMTRDQAAKIFSNFAMNVLCRKPNITMNIEYADTQDVDATLKPYLTLAYQLGLMRGAENNAFRPHATITKAEFNAVLVRLILSSYLPETGELWYQNYNDVATDLGIITMGAGDTPVSRHDGA
ncbi:MAG: nidogen-like domain-containing protein, partial [Candidatus Absconditabacterales bacterium]